MDIDSFAIKDVTRLRRRARRWAEFLDRCRYFIEDIVYMFRLWKAPEAEDRGVVGSDPNASWAVAGKFRLCNSYADDRFGKVAGRLEILVQYLSRSLERL